MLKHLTLFIVVLYTEGPLDGSLYATVSKKKYTDVLIHPHMNQDTFADVEGPHSIDSGISSSSGIRNVGELDRYISRY